MKINLLTETEEVLKANKLAWRNIKYIANAEGLVSVGEFITLAQYYNYDNSGDGVDVDPTLVIVGGSWWLSRIKVGDQEKWLFHKKPKKPTLRSTDFTIKALRSPNKIVLL